MENAINQEFDKFLELQKHNECLQANYLRLVEFMKENYWNENYEQIIELAKNDGVLFLIELPQENDNSLWGANLKKLVKLHKTAKELQKTSRQMCMELITQTNHSIDHEMITELSHQKVLLAGSLNLLIKSVQEKNINTWNANFDKVVEFARDFANRYGI